MERAEAEHPSVDASDAGNEAAGRPAAVPAEVRDEVDEQSDQSLPASDPPSFSRLSLQPRQPMPTLEVAEVPAIELEVRNPSGLHARPAALFVEAARRFSAEVTIANETRDPSKVASARSLLGLLALGVSHGHTIRISADGEDAGEALDALGKLIESGMGEPVAPVEPS
jgi:phosphotransferase system HPr (HPr) family protein